MRLPESSRLFGPLLAACALAAYAPAQEEGAQTEDLFLDRLVDDLWAGSGPRAVLAADVQGDLLELSLQAARAISLTNDLQLQGAEAVVEAAQFRELGSWGAFDWVFNAEGNLSENEADASNIFDADTGTVETSTQGLSFGFDRAFSSGGSLSLSYSHDNVRTNSFFNLLSVANQDALTAVYTRPLMRASGSEYTTSLQRIADLRWQREQEGFRVARLGLLLRVESHYWDLALAEHQLRVAGSALDLALEQLDRDRRRREAGVATEVEVIQGEATVARRIEGVLFAETSHQSAMDLLRSTLFPGVGMDTWTVHVKTTTDFPVAQSAPGADLWQAEINAALQRRGEVRMSALDLEIAEVNHGRTLSEKRPLLDLLVQVSSQGYDGSVGATVEEVLGYEFPSITAGLSLQLPMSNIALDNEEKAARAELRAARLVLDAQRSTVAAELREALRQVRYTSEAMRAATKSREASQRLMNAERSRHEQGLSTNFQVLEYQQALVEAQYAEQATRADYGKALSALAGARGLLGDSREVGGQ